ncbi:MAG: PaREP1 family protein [Caldivirga sp.]|uniref:PaREP1 family protein n=1 Tax=Caldivirga sp. TaxID=2080243 RepID=UPI003D0BC82B
MYKAVEEVIKALAEKYRTPEYLEAVRAGRWFAYLLQRASNTLALMLGDFMNSS